ncbi:FG-GAP-like repeat-containing protein [Microbacterium terricola]|uniref:FG-GAP-like repeat-containing protein n=1 Tax=Microbacterium terricola TaxID=344163 RepID=UPI0021E74C0E|nr:FG-GAP-like repeat-containing protein [Microbacterium terricola]UYK40238.1 FG-GAP-like repeat-containing protein [Microbacterium terricola]
MAPLSVVTAAPAMAATASLSGRVLNADGSPASGVWIDAWRLGASSSADRTRTDTQGEFVIQGLRAGGTYHLSVVTGRDEGYATGFFTGDRADPESEDRSRARVFLATSSVRGRITLQREARTSVSGVFVNADGTPRANAEVYVYGVVDYTHAPVGEGPFGPTHTTRTAADGTFTVRGLETSGDEFDGHVVALHRGLTGWSGFIGEDPSTGLVPADRARVHPLTTAPIDAGTVTIPVATLPADQIVLGQGLTVDNAGTGAANEIIAVSGGTLSAFPVHDGVVQPGIPIRSGLSGQKIYAPGNWGRNDYFYRPEGAETVPRDDIIGVDGSGDMFLYEGDGYGYLRPPVKIGSGWQHRRLTFSADLDGDNRADMLSIDKNGVLRLHRGNGKGGFVSPSHRVSTGWKGDHLFAAGDLNEDYKADLISVDSSGVLWTHLGRGNGTFRKPIRVSSGWKSLTIATGADIDDDRHYYADIVARDATGRLYLYSGRGDGRFKTRKLIATGW